MSEPETISLASTYPFIVTKEYRRFVEFCDACRRQRYIGICFGLPGVGKTLSAREYAGWDTSGTRLVDASNRAILYTPGVANNPRQILNDIERLRERLSYRVVDTSPPSFEPKPWPPPDCTELLIIDEADRLKMAALEQVRDCYDRGCFGVVLIGMPGIEKRLSRYAQLYSRVGFLHQYRPLCDEELQLILQQKWSQMGLTLQANDFTDTEAVAAIARFTNGKFRVVQRLFAQIERILQINNLQVITKEVVDAASAGLLIGPT
jgi:DNA transposition AAA+ family ATPase